MLIMISFIKFIFLKPSLHQAQLNHPKVDIIFFAFKNFSLIPNMFFFIFKEPCGCEQNPAIVDLVIAGVKALLEAVLVALFGAVKTLITTIVNALVSILVAVIGKDKVLAVADILDLLTSLENPTIGSLVAALLEFLGIDGCLIIGIIPTPVANIPVNVEDLVSQLEDLAKGETSVGIQVLIDAVGTYIIVALTPSL